MGTKIFEPITINPFGEIDIKIGFRRSECRVDDRRKCRQSKELTKYERRFRVRSMDRVLDRQTLESIRMTMQAQEELFKHQVQELHRVYSLQKIMMEELENEIKSRQHWNNINSNSSKNLFSIDVIKNSCNQITKERSGSCSGADLDNPAREISAVDLGRLTRTNGSDIMDESELELTLSIGMSSSSSTTLRSYNQNNNRALDSSTTSFRSDSCNNNKNNNNNNNNNNHNNNNNQECSGASTPMSSSSTTLDEEKKKPRWLIQGLSINRT